MVAAVVLFVVLAGVFGVSYALNAKTPVPEGCEKLHEDCTGCRIMDCVHRKES